MKSNVSKIKNQQNDLLMPNYSFKINEKNSKQSQKKKIEQIVCFLPCCKHKCATGRIVGKGSGLTKEDLPNTWNLLRKGREKRKQDLNFSSQPTSAIYLYKGWMYNTFNSYIPNIIQRINSGKLRLFIISAGYGIVNAFEPLHEYDVEMTGKIASHWKRKGLINIISDLLLTLNPSKVFGFFAGKSSWSSSRSKYRFFFTEGLRKASDEDLNTEFGGCFYRAEGFGIPAILGALGRTFLDLMNSEFNTQFITNIQNNGRIDRKITIGYKKIP